MRNLYLAIALGFSMVACQGADTGKNKKEKNEEDASLTGNQNAGGDLEDKYQNALLSDTEVEEKEEKEEEEEKKDTKPSGLASMIMGLFDKDGDSMLSVKELDLMVKFTKNLVAKIALPDLMKPEKKPQDGDKEKDKEDKEADKEDKGEDKEADKEDKPEKPELKGSIKDKIFACMDANSDGTISKDEFSEAKGPFALHKCMMGKDHDKKDEDKKD